MVVRPQPYRFTVAEYERIGSAGVFEGGLRLELIDGEILPMTPIGSQHAAVVKRLSNFFAARSQDRFIVGVQDPVRLGEYDEPQPDLGLLRPMPNYYADAHPGPQDILLLVEVADATSAFDRQTKIPLYAGSGVRESWLADIPRGVLEVFRRPAPEGYGLHETLGPGDAVAPGALSDLELKIEDLFL